MANTNSSRINIEIKGIERDVSPAMAPIGSCQEMVNLRIWDGALRPIRPKKAKYQATAGEFIPPPGETELTTYTLTIVLEGNGVVNVNGSPLEGTVTFPKDQSVSIEALPDYGYLFTQWDDGPAGAEPTKIITMDSNITIKAVFTYADELGIYNEAGTVEITEPINGTGENYQYLMIKAPINGWYIESITESGSQGQTWVVAAEELSTGAWLTLVKGRIYPHNTVIRVITTHPPDTGIYQADIVFRTPGSLTKNYNVYILVN